MKQRQVSLHLWNRFLGFLSWTLRYGKEIGLSTGYSIHPSLFPYHILGHGSHSLYLEHSSLNVITTPMQHQCSVNSCQFFLPPVQAESSQAFSLPPSTLPSPVSWKEKDLPLVLLSFVANTRLPITSPAGTPSTLAVPFIQHFVLYLINSLQTGFCISYSHHHYPSPTPNPVPFLVVTLLIFPAFSSGPEHRSGSSKWPVISLSC